MRAVRHRRLKPTTPATSAAARTSKESRRPQSDVPITPARLHKRSTDSRIARRSTGAITDPAKPPIRGSRDDDGEALGRSRLASRNRNAIRNVRKPTAARLAAMAMPPARRRPLSSCAVVARLRMRSPCPSPLGGGTRAARRQQNTTAASHSARSGPCECVRCRGDACADRPAHNGEHRQPSIAPHELASWRQRVGHKCAAADAVDAGQHEQAERERIESEALGPTGDSSTRERRGRRQPGGSRAGNAPRRRSSHGPISGRQHGERRHSEREVERDLVARLADRRGEEQRVRQRHGDHAVTDGVDELYSARRRNGIQVSTLVPARRPVAVVSSSAIPREW